jgi:hypothetical protein
MNKRSGSQRDQPTDEVIQELFDQVRKVVDLAERLFLQLSQESLLRPATWPASRPRVRYVILSALIKDVNASPKHSTRRSTREANTSSGSLSPHAGSSCGRTAVSRELAPRRRSKDRVAFWRQLHERIATLANRIDAVGQCRHGFPSAPRSVQPDVHRVRRRSTVTRRSRSVVRAGVPAHCKGPSC